jgi:hypothetical protein
MQVFDAWPQPAMMRSKMLDTSKRCTLEEHGYRAKKLQAPLSEDKRQIQSRAS